MNTQLTQTLEQAVDGLSYPSESDEPFEVVSWPGDGHPIDAGKLLHLVGAKPKTHVETISANDFFKDLTTEQPWYGQNEMRNLQRFRDLENILMHSLKDIQVFRVGDVQVDIYVIGTSAQGYWTGVKTTSVET